MTSHSPDGTKVKVSSRLPQPTRPCSSHTLTPTLQSLSNLFCDRRLFENYGTSGISASNTRSQWEGSTLPAGSMSMKQYISLLSFLGVVDSPQGPGVWRGQVSSQNPLQGAPTPTLNTWPLFRATQRCFLALLVRPENPKLHSQYYNLLCSCLSSSPTHRRPSQESMPDSPMRRAACPARRRRWRSSMRAGRLKT